MRKRDVIGRTIVRVNEERGYNECSRSMETTISSLVLDNGALIMFTAVEEVDVPLVNARVLKRDRTGTWRQI